jgi:hypothetical protein
MHQVKHQVCRLHQIIIQSAFHLHLYYACSVEGMDHGTRTSFIVQKHRSPVATISLLHAILHQALHLLLAKRYYALKCATGLNR